MKKLLRVLLLAVIPFVSMASETKNGTLSVLVFSDGKPLFENEVKVDGKRIYKTDSDGAVKVSLRPGKHQVEIFGKGEKGENLGYFKKPVMIKTGRDTEVIATLSKRGTDSIDIDTPVALAASVVREAQKATGEGILSGRVLSSEGNTPVAGARVFVRGTSVDVRTDENGRFSAKVPSGKRLSISAVHSAYSAQTVVGIIVKKDGTTSTTVKLTPASMELEEFVVLAPKIKGSLSEVMQEEKKSSAVTNILGSEEMSKKGDSDAASALKRVTGVTLVDGKSIYVRGLGDRYSNIEMNSMPLPSPDPTKRVVPLDIFPSGVISSMKVQKSGTANIPASFGGGYVDIRTKDSADKDYIKISLGAKGNSYTGKEVMTYQGSDGDWTGFDDGYRAIDPSVLDAIKVKDGGVVYPLASGSSRYYYTNQQYHDLMVAFVGDRQYGATYEKLPFGGSMGVEGAKTFELDNENIITVFGNYGYSQEHTYREEALTKYEYNQKEDKLYDDPANFGVALRSSSEYTQSGILNIGYNFADVFKLRYTKLYTHTGVKDMKYTEGEFGSNQNEIYMVYDLGWEERTLEADQLNGDLDYQLFNHKNTLAFGMEKSTATLYQPANYRYTYIDNDGTGTGDDPFLYQSASKHYVTMLESDDEVKAWYIKNRFFLDIFGDEDYLEVGYAHSSKERVSGQYQLGLNTSSKLNLTEDIDTIYDIYIISIDPDTRYNRRPIYLSSLTEGSDFFEAEVEESSQYVNTFLKPFTWLDMMFGVRQVDIEQRTRSYDYELTTVDGKRALIYYYTPDSVYELDGEFFPSASLKFKVDEANMIDVAYSKTFIMPDLREASPGTYSHPYEIADIKGNPDLKHTLIQSYDIKYSHYFSATESIKLGLFYKDMKDPIEDTLEDSSSLPVYSFMNSQSATLYGVEIDGRKGLGFLHSMFRDFYLSGNFTYTDSEVVVPPEKEDELTTNHRQLQGLSQTVVNLALSYERPDRSITLAYNKMGERIRLVGRKRRVNATTYDFIYPDTMEDPAAVLDLVWIEKFNNGLSVKLKLGNLLDEWNIWYQQDPAHTIKQYKKGRNFSLGLSYTY